MGSKLADIPHEQMRSDPSTRYEPEGIVLDLSPEDVARPHSSNVVIEPATREDLRDIRALVVAAQLPLAGLEDQFPGAFTVARYGQEVVGVAGLQRYGRFGLLRSVTDAGAWRGAGIARTLIAARFAAARVAGVEGVYLLTTDATAWFLRLGFEQVARDAAPSELMVSPEFVDACPASAACLWASSSAQLQLSAS